jgi:glutathione S-transferase
MAASKSRTHYELYYWSEIQGRGEFVRLALEDAGARYTDVARERGGEKRMQALLKTHRGSAPAPFAPPFLRAGRLLIAQTSAILHFLAPRLGLVPEDEKSRFAALQHQLTISDFVAEAHDTHHPIGVGLYYEAQKREARARSEQFLNERMPKFMGYFERELAAQRGKRRAFLLGTHSYVDLSLFQVFEGLSYAFPNAFAKLARRLPLIAAVHERVAARPRIAEYLRSPRRIPFNEYGIYRHYPELDLAVGGTHRAAKRSAKK